MTALETGVVEVVRLSATRCFELLEADDEGPGYFFDVGEGRIAQVATGQELGDLVAAGTFPCDEFKVEWLPTLGTVLTLTPAGEPLAPEHWLELSELVGDTATFGSDAFPEPFAVLEGRLESLGEDLRRQWTNASSARP